jgi:hypothetical protein
MTRTSACSAERGPGRGGAVMTRPAACSAERRPANGSFALSAASAAAIEAAAAREPRATGAHAWMPGVPA